MQYASIKSRCAAFLIDLLALWYLSFLVTKLLIYFTLAALSASLTIRNAQLIHQLVWESFLINIILMIILFGLFEGFLLPATIGKMILKLRIVTIDGNPMRIANAVLRWLYKMVPYIMNMYINEYFMLGRIQYLRNHQDLKLSDFLPAEMIGIALIFFSLTTMILASHSKQKQALHDKMAKTLVIKTNKLGLFQVIWQKLLQCLKFLRTVGHSD